tara:strand:+ start:253 stop:444 length:192 start_codon:yes stop_codon:yes gene_type:complete
VAVPSEAAVSSRSTATAPPPGCAVVRWLSGAKARAEMALTSPRLLRVRVRVRVKVRGRGRDRG